jgi:MFS family permease
MLPAIPPTEKISADEPGTKSESATKPEEQMSALSILWRIKTSCFAAFSYGYFQAAAVLFLPRFVIVAKGIPDDKTRIFPGLFCFGMLACSNIAGRIADHVGHLKTVRVLSAIGLVAIFGFAYMDSYWMMCIVIIIAGATFASMSPVALALTGVVVKPHDYSRANSIYNMFYATGILLGPVISGAIFTRWDGAVMLQHQVALWAVFVVFTMVFRKDDPAFSRRQQGLPAH